MDERGSATATQPDDGARLTDRVAKLEQLVEELAELVHRSGAASDAPSSAPRTPDLKAPSASSTGTPASNAPDAAPSQAFTAPAHETPAGDDPFWALRALKERLPAPGGVVYTGSVDVGQGHVEYQWGRPTEHLLQSDWAEHAESVAALGHPLRLAIMRKLLDAEHTVAQLVDELELASTGVAYHHLSALQNGGWVTSPRRGTWTVPVSRVVPLLTIITALEKG
ncbi:helix-turn-helix domain-containing protein [Brachybacterium muris]|uniref:ArsR/SmtB family transcription factor n=1 Tax=Brachybacterium muris TaxID=219301 RepID=UPI00223B68BB|nr:helix-turn-helix domain-containing protein [Brachybacterium muris]MCT2296707.1 helix-turn-helix domain-containing protein [Brachybacterium muris]